MAGRTQGRNFITDDNGIGGVPTSTTSTGQFTELSELDGLYRTPGLTVKHHGNGPIVQAVITLSGAPLTITDDAGTAQYGGLQIYDYPAGALLSLGAVVDGSVSPNSTSDAGTLTTTFDGDVAIGTITATTGATLVSTEANILISNALTQAVASVANCDAQPSATQVTESAAVWIDGTATAADAFLNFVIDDSAAHGASVGTVDAVVTLTYLMLGDN